MSKKLIITLSIVFSFLAVILILFWTLFALSSVSVEFHSTTLNLSSVTNEEIIKAGEFRYGACVLFEGKNSSIQKINSYVKENEKFAYLRVLNIETIFPNKFVIHVAEREELFAIETESQVLICDRDLRVLRIENEFSSTDENAILVKNLEILNDTVEIGDFLSVKQKSILNFYSVMLQNNRSLAQQLGKFKELKVDSFNDEITGKEYYSFTIKTFQDRVFIINNPDFAFVNKVQKMFSAESSLFSQKVVDGKIVDADGNPIYVKLSESGEYTPCEESDLEGQVLTYALLYNCAIKVDNMTLDDHIKRTEKDIYYSLVKLD